MKSKMRIIIFSCNLTFSRDKLLQWFKLVITFFFQHAKAINTSKRLIIRRGYNVWFNNNNVDTIVKHCTIW